MVHRFNENSARLINFVDFKHIKVPTTVTLSTVAYKGKAKDFMHYRSLSRRMCMKTTENNLSRLFI